MGVHEYVSASPHCRIAAKVARLAGAAFKVDVFLRLCSAEESEAFHMDATRVLLRDRIAVTRTVALNDPTDTNVRAHGWAIMNLWNALPQNDDPIPLPRIPVDI